MDSLTDNVHSISRLLNVLPLLAQTAEEIRAAGAAARAAALGGLVARAETEAGTRAAARRAAADWLRGDLPEEEVELLRANIVGKHYGWVSCGTSCQSQE